MSETVSASESPPVLNFPEAWPRAEEHPVSQWLGVAISVGTAVATTSILAGHVAHIMPPIVLGLGVLALMYARVLGLPLKAWHVLYRDENGQPRLERRLVLFGKVVRRRVVDLNRYSWMRVVLAGYSHIVRLELGNPQYLTHTLAAVSSGGPKYPLWPAEQQKARAELLQLAEQVSQLTGIENRGFREHH
ncbi:MAG: hypothetical protein Q4D19_13105 [Lautropia sp.]|nr:hypothetical protein [Lautropia sp.]